MEVNFSDARGIRNADLQKRFNDFPMLLTASYSPANDAENYTRTLFDQAYHHYGDTQRNQNILAEIENEKIRALLTKGTIRDEVFSGITEILEKQPARSSLDEKARALQEAWKERGDQIIFQLESLYEIPCPFEQVTTDLTTISSCPYQYKKRQIFIHAMPGIQAQLRILSHELNHFFFYWKYTEKLSVVLNKEELETLKESLTLFTNPEQKPYPNAKLLIEQYLVTGADSIEKAIEVGTAFLIDKRRSS